MVKEIKCNLVIPSCSGLLDCFNTSTGGYGHYSLCHLLVDDELGVNTMMLISLFSFIYYHCERSETGVYQFKMADFKRYRHHTHGKYAIDIAAELKGLESVDCVFQDIVRSFASVNIKGRHVKIKSPYIKDLINAMNTLTLKVDGKHKPSYTSLVKSSILKERSHSRAEIIIEICKLVERRGQSEYKMHTSNIKVENLLKRCPTLLKRWKNAPSNSRRNHIIREDVTKALELLEKHTKLHQEFKAVQVMLPKRTEIDMDAVIEIKHRGRVWE